MKVYEKITKILRDEPKPYFFPLYEEKSCPVFPSKCILLSFSNTALNRLPSLDYENCLIMIESGGLASVKPEDKYDCIKRQLRLKPDLVLSLDIPIKLSRQEKGVKNIITKCRVCGSEIKITKLSASCTNISCNAIYPELVGLKDTKKFVQSNFEQKLSAVDTTIKNAKFLIEKRDEFVSSFDHNFEPVAVIQSFDTSSMIYCTEAMYSLGYNFFAFGGISVGSYLRRQILTTVIDSFVTIKDIIGKKSWLHALGITDIKVLKCIKNYIDSFDSAYISIQAKNAHLVRSNGRETKVATKGGVRSPEALLYDIYRKDRKGNLTLDYKKLQLINFKNYTEKLKRFIWSC